MTKEKSYQIVEQCLKSHFTDGELSVLGVCIDSFTVDDLNIYVANDSNDMSVLIGDLNCSLNELYSDSQIINDGH